MAKTHAVVCVFALLATTAYACTNILVSKGASATGNTQLAYNADSGNLYGSLGFYPAQDHPAGAKREIWDWDSSMYLGTIPEVNHTYNVVGNMNEFGLVIGETTFGGLKQLDGHGTGAIMDYGSLIWVTLQRAKTCEEAITIMDNLVQTYGYASDGESFSLADGNSIWLMELVGKGKEKGAVWVASKVPEGYIGSTANQARTRTFKWDDPENVRYAKDVMTFAQKVGLYPKDGKQEDFSFSDVYDPVSFGGMRLAEARVWNIFHSATNGGFMQYLDYAKGYNASNRMPLFAKVAKPFTVEDTMNHMRTHFEGTWFDNQGVLRKDVGAGSGNSAYRWRPLEWKSKNKSFVNERTVGVQQTAWTFVAETRVAKPMPLRGLFWFCPDDSSTAVRAPFYTSITKIPASFGDPYGQMPAAAVSYGAKADAYKMSLDSAFWVWNLVANIAYGDRYKDAMPLIQAKIKEVQESLFQKVEEMDKKAEAMLKEDPKGTIEMLTNFSVDTGDALTKEWLEFWMFLFSRLRDGFLNMPAPIPQCKEGQKENCTFRYVPESEQAGYTDAWYERIVGDSNNAEHYAVHETSVSKEHAQWKLKRMEKLR